MFEILVEIGLVGAYAYAAAGLLVALVLPHSRYLGGTHPDSGGPAPPHPIVRALGMTCFWPLFLRRPRPAASAPKYATPARPPIGLQRTVFVASAVLALAGLAAAVLLREPPALPGRVEVSLPGPPPYLIQRGPGPVLGRLFPTMPANFQRARDINKAPGLFMMVDAGATVAPTAIYWSPSLVQGNTIPEEAILVATVWGSERSFFPFTESNMWDRGYWIAYSHVRQEAEVYATGNPSNRTAS